VENLYFAYLFVLRAVLKAAPVLTSYEYNTGLADEDAATRQIMTQLVRAALTLCVCVCVCVCVCARARALACLHASTRVGRNKVLRR
jgi:hypothetical protein